MTNQQSFEMELKNYFSAKKIPFADHCKSMDRLDFDLFDNNKKLLFSFDAKEKRQNYNLSNWPKFDVPQEHVFIIDDLAARKILKESPESGLIIRDNLISRYIFFSVVDLMLMPKLRVNRPIEKNISTLKGKWLIDLRNGQSASDLEGILAKVREYILSFDAVFSSIIECYGDFTGEKIPSGGITRKPEHWQIDNSTTH